MACSGICFSRLPWVSLAISVIALTIVQFVPFPGFKASNNSWPYSGLNVDAYPMPMAAKDTVPAYALGIFLVALATVLVIVEIRLNKGSDLRFKVEFAMLIVMTLIEVFMVTITLTSIAKVFVSEPRPDFRMRCLETLDATPTFDEDGNVICTGATALVLDGRQSFPSGHASGSMCVGAFGTLFLIWFVHLRKIELPWRTTKGTQSTLAYQLTQAFFFLPMVPMFIALGIAATRVRDHRHSPADVTAGAFLGFLVACCYFFGRLMRALPETRSEKEALLAEVVDDSESQELLCHHTEQIV